jgi:hypothetical protein
MFGDDLVEQGAISEPKLEAAIELQKGSKATLDRLGDQQGMMTLDPMFEVLKNQDEIDKLFGEIAVSHGFLATG